MALSYLKLFYSFREDIALLTMEERGRLVTAMLEYAQTGADPSASLTGNERFLFPVCRQRIDRDVESYNQLVETRRTCGAKGGRPRKNQMVISKSKKTQDKEQEKEEEQEQDKGEGEGKEKNDGAPSPAPTLSEVLEFCRREAPSVDGERFFNHYQAVGWLAGNRPITDWRAKLREWERGNATGLGPAVGYGPSASAPSSASPKNDNPALNYIQRDYTDEEYDNMVHWFDNET